MHNMLVCMVKIFGAVGYSDQQKCSKVKGLGGTRTSSRRGAVRASIGTAVYMSFIMAF